MYALAFWQGNRFMQSDSSSIDVGGIIVTLLAIITGTFTLAVMAPNIQAFVSGSSAARSVFKVIDRQSPIDFSSSEGLDASGVKGDIRFDNIRLVYPSRPDVSALQGFNLTVPAGKTTALVGPSGSGKTSVVGLLERFYNPVEGTVSIDGVDINDYNIASLRNRISVVSQEPILFSKSVRDNIAFGLPKKRIEALTASETDKLVREAAVRARAHSFIQNLPQAYDSVVGDRGVLLSGGQRQRVAVARAIISEPQILLLDEATSALDTESEREVQNALSEMAQDRTTIVIAHRLSTIRHADEIAVVSQGKVCEQGSHKELLEQGGMYKMLVEAQDVGNDHESTSKSDLDGASRPVSSTDGDLEITRSLSRGHGGNLSKVHSVLSKHSASLRDGKGAEKATGPPSPSLWAVIKFVYQFNYPERWIMLAGCLLSIISGLVQPVVAVLFAKSIFALATPAGYGRGVDFWAAMYLMMSFVALIALAGRGVAFGKASARLTRRLRMHLFAHILSQEAAWFDQSEHGPGMLSSMLSTEPENIAGVSGATLGTLIDGCVTLLGGCILALAIGWKLALVCIALVPVLLLGGFVQVAMQSKFQERAKATFEGSAAFACEMIAGLRTVAALSLEREAWRLYHDQLYAAERSGMKWVLFSSAAFSLSQAVPFLIFALVFWYGGGLVASGEYGVEQFFISMVAPFDPFSLSLTYALSFCGGHLWCSVRSGVFRLLTGCQQGSNRGRQALEHVRPLLSCR